MLLKWLGKANMGKEDYKDYNKNLLTKDHIYLTSKRGGGLAEHMMYLWKTRDSNNNDNDYGESSYLRTEINRKPQKTAEPNRNASFFCFKL